MFGLESMRYRWCEVNERCVAWSQSDLRGLESCNVSGLESM